MSDRQKLFFALLASAFLHILIFYVLARWPTKHANDVLAAPKRDLSQLTVTIMPPKAAAPQAPVPALAAAAASPTPLPVLDSDGLKKSAKAPEHALFQSDANMVAGSLLPGTGDIPVPSEAGPRRNFKEFANQPASMGKGEAPSQPRPMHHARPAPQPPAMPVQTPYAVTQVRRAATPPPTPVPTPTPSADNIALGHQTPTPEPAAQLPTPIAELARLAPRAPSLRAQADMAPMEPPEPEAPPEPASPEGSMQKRTDRTRIDGGITAVGPDGVDAVETPFGRYHRKLSNLIGSRWQLYLQEHPKDVGDVTILVALDTRGKVTHTRVLANHSLDDLAELSTRAILESDLPPVPDDLAPMLRDGKLEITFNFNVYDPNNESPGR